MEKPTNLLKVDRFLFDLSAKCGSNSVMVVILHDKGLKMGSDKVKDSYWHYHRSNSTTDVLPDHVNIKVVRDPYKRAVSSFIHYCRASGENHSFIDWLLKVKKLYTLDTESIKKIFPKANEITSDLFYLQTNSEEIEFDHVIKVEYLKEEIENLNNLYGSSFPIPTKNLNVRAKTSIPKQIEYSSSKFQNYVNHIPSEYSKFYSEESLALVNEIYKKDIDRFEYTYSL